MGDYTPRHRELAHRVRATVEGLPAGSRLPSIRALMADLDASQATIERCLDELERKGLIRRERGRGVFVQGPRVGSGAIGVYTDGEHSPYPNALFLDGVRSAAAELGFRVADFGPRRESESPHAVLTAMRGMGVDGVVAALSTAASLAMEGDAGLSGSVNDLDMPIITTRPLAAVAADSVTFDYYPAFAALGRHLRQRASGPFLFLGHQGLPSLARLHGLRAGLGDKVDFRFEILDGASAGAFRRVGELKRQRWQGSLIVGVPPADPGTVDALAGSPWSVGGERQLAVTLETGQRLPDGVDAHLLLRPSRRLGEAAARLLIQRIQHRAGPLRHEVVPHEMDLR